MVVRRDKPGLEFAAGQVVGLRQHFSASVGIDDKAAWQSYDVARWPEDVEGDPVQLLKQLRAHPVSGCPEQDAGQ